MLGEPFGLLLILLSPFIIAGAALYFLTSLFD